ncbi:52 kDa repressor of the inhibitor of the protein kinase-like [Ixodes scapularis]|uniref:52 kDa repressor of the inhibitor of the protein kinase-like n=1 Tax=Ixodes scapularis TaxID=6945 RepID=UPI001C385A1B|nr:52 kDa repressor of the inhibitor of the protein kinase-like [Ixodes scapularis]
MATKRTLLDVWLGEPKKAAVEKEKPPEVLESIGNASVDHLKPRSTEKPHESGSLDTPSLASGDKLDIGCYCETRCKGLDDSVKRDLLTKPWAPDSDYKLPAVQSGKGWKRKFQMSWLQRWPWLTYSHVRSAVFCRSCVLLGQGTLGKGDHVKPGALITAPFTNWKKAIEVFSAHQTSKHHMDAQVSVDNFLQTTSGSRPNILSQIDNQRRQAVENNRKRLVPVIDTIICGRQGIALRGHNDSGPLMLDKDPEENDGNFRALLRMRGKCGDASLQTHFSTASANATYISPRTQNELIGICGNIIQDSIVKRVNEAKAFSVLADETMDIGGLEQMSVCVRYVQDDEVREEFLGYAQVHDLSGRALAKEIIKFLSGVGINLRYLRGQGYDGAAAMSGRLNGVQAAVLEEHPSALFLHCASHCLNLVLCDAATVPDIRNCMSTVREICSFFRGSPIRSKVLVDKVGLLCPESRKRRLVSLCETRWVERHDCILAIIELLEPIAAALQQLDESGASDNASRAHMLLLSASSSAFLISLHTAAKALALTLPLSKALQAVSIDLPSALSYVKEVNAALGQMRQNVEHEFKSIFDGATKAAEFFDTVIELPRRRGNVSILNDPESFYRVQVCVPFLDYLNSQLKVPNGLCGVSEDGHLINGVIFGGCEKGFINGL